MTRWLCRRFFARGQRRPTPCLQAGARLLRSSLPHPPIIRAQALRATARDRALDAAARADAQLNLAGQLAFAGDDADIAEAVKLLDGEASRPPEVHMRAAPPAQRSALGPVSLFGISC